ncbi:MAG: terminase [Actinobacteria bacterium]|nr:terminase [Actinomycetota bacterium]
MMSSTPESNPGAKRRAPNTKRDWIPGFLAALRDRGNVRAAARAAQVDRSTPYKLRGADPVFANAWEDAMDDAADVLEAEARRRATLGVDEPVFYKGVPVGSVKRYSDTLLMFLLKGARPHIYRERFGVEYGGPPTRAPVDIDDARRRLEERLDELAARRAAREN